MCLNGRTLDGTVARRRAAFWAATVGSVTQELAGGGVEVPPVVGGRPIRGVQAVREPTSVTHHVRVLDRSR